MSPAASIQGRLMLWIFLFVSAMVILFDLVLFHKFREVIFSSMDNILHSKLQIVKGLIHSHGDYIEFEFNEVVLGEYVIPGSGHYYQVYTDNSLTFASSSLVPREFDLLAGTIESHDEEMQEWIYRLTGPGGEPLRVLHHEFQFSGKTISIRVAETLKESLAILDRVRRFFCLVTPFFVVLIGFVAITISSYALRPLKIFCLALEKITHKSLDDRLDTKGLALELQGLAEKFNALLARLQTAFDTEKELIANAAHELKTPLTVIRAECDIILQKERTGKEYADSLREIKSVSDTMRRQINGMLTLARLDSGMLSGTAFRHVSLNTCLDDALRLVAPLAKKKHIGIHREEGDAMTVLGDKDALTEAILNILENAVSYNLPDGSVSVQSGIRKNRSELRIIDTGIGIREDEVEQIFNKFYRSEGVKHIRGTGLGLSIAKAVLQAHDGDIIVQHAESGGSCFLLTLPLQDAEQLNG